MNEGLWCFFFFFKYNSLLITRKVRSWLWGLETRTGKWRTWTAILTPYLLNCVDSIIQSLTSLLFRREVLRWVLPGPSVPCPLWALASRSSNFVTTRISSAWTDYDLPPVCGYACIYSFITPMDSGCPSGCQSTWPASAVFIGASCTWNPQLMGLSKVNTQ